MRYRIRGKSFDDVSIGNEVVTSGRTITETDIVNFASISGDFHPEHMNEEFAKNSPAGTRIAHGILTVAISVGLINQTGIFEGTTISVLEMKTRFTKAVKPGDTIYAIFKITGKRETKKPDRGIIKAEVHTFNQYEESVMSGECLIMLYRKGYPKGSL